MAIGSEYALVDTLKKLTPFGAVMQMIDLYLAALVFDTPIDT